MAANEVLAALMRTNIAAGMAILVTVVLRRPVRRMFGARLAYGLWLLPLLATLAVLAPARRIVVETQAAAPLAAISAQPAPPVLAISAPATAIVIDPTVLVIGLWLAGVFIAALVMIDLQRRFMAEVRKGVIGPAVVGVISPKIITPMHFDAQFSGEEQALVLAHEQAHIGRHDSRLNAVSAVLQCLFWFNPLVHLAAHLARIDQELACDETVVTRFPTARGAYAKTLVKAQLAIRPLPLGCYWPSRTEHPLFERIAMMKWKEFGPARRAAGGILLGLSCVGASVAAWAAQPSVIVHRQMVQRMAIEIPEMKPTGAMLPAFGSHPPGTPRAVIDAATPEMTPTGAMRVIMEPVTQLQQAPTPVTVPPGYALQTALTDAEARGQRVTVDGVLARVQWVNPQALITIVDAKGLEVTIASETPNTLLRQGINRNAIRAGMPLRIDGFRAADGSIQARGAAFTSDGRRLAIFDNAGNPLPATGAPQGAIIEQSPLTNSVIREGGG